MSTTIVTELAPVDETLQVLIAGASEHEGETPKENAPESAALEASLVAFATVESVTEYSTEASACQIAAAPTLEEIENEIAAAAQPTARHDCIIIEQNHKITGLRLAQANVVCRRKTLVRIVQHHAHKWCGPLQLDQVRFDFGDRIVVNDNDLVIRINGSLQDAGDTISNQVQPVVRDDDDAGFAVEFDDRVAQRPPRIRRLLRENEITHGDNCARAVTSSNSPVDSE